MTCFVSQIQPYSGLASPGAQDAVRAMLDQLVVIKLNGGLGTSMGCRWGHGNIEITREYKLVTAAPSL